MAHLVAYRFGSFELRPADHMLLNRGKRVPLPPKAFDLLQVLVEHAGVVVSKQQLMDTLWPDAFVEETNLSVQIAAVRKGLGVRRGAALIETVARRGYRFAGRVERLTTPTTERSPIRLAVLPLRTVAPVPGGEFLAFSFPETMAIALADHAWLAVRTPRSAGGTAGADRARAAHDASDAVLEGMLGARDGQPHIHMWLTEPASGAVLLSKEFPASPGTLFEQQERLAGEVAQTLGARAGFPAAPHGPRGVPATPAAYVFYLRATQLDCETSQWLQAIELYHAALQEDAAYAPAWARLARCYRVLAKFGGSRARTPGASYSLALAEATFQRALALDPALPLAHSLYAQLEVDLGRAADAMVRLLRQAARRPHAAELYAGLVHALRFCGLLDASVAAHTRARALDPSIHTSIHHTWWMKGEYTKALAETVGDIGYMPGLALASLGNTREAVAALRWRERESSESGVTLYIASLRALLEGRDDECRHALNRATVEDLDPEARYYLARTYARLGDASRALDEMARVVDGGFASHETFARDPWLAPLASDPRFGQLCERARLAADRAAQAYEAAAGPALLGGAASTGDQEIKRAGDQAIDLLISWSPGLRRSDS